jgi:hypothetical protein
VEAIGTSEMIVMANSVDDIGVSVSKLAFCTLRATCDHQIQVLSALLLLGEEA